MNTEETKISENAFWHWPDRAIGKRESRRLREEHNKAMNELSALKESKGTLQQVEFEEQDFPIAEKIAKRLGFTQTAYTSTSALWGMFCLPDRANQRHGCIVKTKELGFLFVANLEDMHMEDLQP